MCDTFRLQPVAGKGLGLVATRPIQKGERFWAERPILILPPEGTTLRQLIAQLPSIEEREQFVCEMVDQLGESSRDAFWGLADAHTCGGGKTAYGIACTNGLSLGGQEAVAGIFPTIARLNHSCMPNVHNQWLPVRQEQVLHAARTIPRGEELCLRYIPLDLDRATRQKRLRRAFGFVCQCDACASSAETIRESDRRRRRLRQLRSAVLSAIRRPSRGVQVVREAVALVDTELQGFPAAKFPFLLAGMRAVARSGQRACACRMAGRARRSALLAAGSDSPLMEEYHAVAEAYFPCDAASGRLDFPSALGFSPVGCTTKATDERTFS
eukprot:GGOE01041429.1.p1 GENE.GGOE01041429.1~~GGOE01041429.1.p1  ORF type:complete len:334 (+),score=50.75 GGOE01041429.1:26-1003(+)